MRATNSKLLGTKILEVSKKFRVELENTYLKDFFEVRTYILELELPVTSKSGFT